MNNIKEMEALRDQFRNIADNIDELINICKREEAGEEVAQEYETAMGKFLINMMKIEVLSK